MASPVLVSFSNGFVLKDYVSISCSNCCCNKGKDSLRALSALCLFVAFSLCCCCLCRPFINNTVAIRCRVDITVFFDSGPIKINIYCSSEFYRSMLGEFSHMQTRRLSSRFTQRSVKIICEARSQETNLISSYRGSACSSSRECSYFLASPVLQFHKHPRSSFDTSNSLKALQSTREYATQSKQAAAVMQVSEKDFGQMMEASQNTPIILDCYAEYVLLPSDYIPYAHLISKLVRSL